MNELKPKLFDTMKGYKKEQLIRDIISGIIVAIIALCVIYCAGDRIGSRTGTGTVYTDEPDITPGEAEKLREIPHSIRVFEIYEPLFFAAADQILNINSDHHTKVVVIRMRSVPAIDASAMRSLREVANRAKKKKITLVFSHVNEQPMSVMEKDGFVEMLGKESFQSNIVDALDYAEQLAGYGKK